MHSVRMLGHDSSHPISISYPTNKKIHPTSVSSYHTAKFPTVWASQRNAQTDSSVSLGFISTSFPRRCRCQQTTVWSVSMCLLPLSSAINIFVLVVLVIIILTTRWSLSRLESILLGIGWNILQMPMCPVCSQRCHWFPPQSDPQVILVIFHSQLSIYHSIMATSVCLHPWPVALPVTHVCPILWATRTPPIEVVQARQWGVSCVTNQLQCASTWESEHPRHSDSS